MYDRGRIEYRIYFKTFDWKLTEEEMKILDSKIEECAL